MPPGCSEICRTVGRQDMLSYDEQKQNLSVSIKVEELLPCQPSWPLPVTSIWSFLHYSHVSETVKTKLKT